MVSCNIPAGRQNQYKRAICVSIDSSTGSAPPDSSLKLHRGEQQPRHEDRSPILHRAYRLYRMTRVGSLEVGRALCHPILTKIGIMVNPFRCTIWKGDKRPWASDAAPSPSLLVRRLLELTLSLHQPQTYLTNCVIEFATHKGCARRLHD